MKRITIILKPVTEVELLLTLSLLQRSLVQAEQELYLVSRAAKLVSHDSAQSLMTINPNNASGKEIVLDQKHVSKTFVVDVNQSVLASSYWYSYSTNMGYMPFISCMR